MADVFIHLEPCGLGHVSLNNSSYQCKETPANRNRDNLIHHRNNRLLVKSSVTAAEPLNWTGKHAEVCY